MPDFITPPDAEPKHDKQAAPAAPLRDNGLTDEGVEKMLSAAGRRKDDPGYIERMMAGVAEYRRQIQEEVERDLTAEADSK